MVPDIVCDYKVMKTWACTLGIQSTVGSVRGLRVRVRLKEGSAWSCEQFLKRENAQMQIQTLRLAFKIRDE